MFIKDDQIGSLPSSKVSYTALRDHYKLPMYSSENCRSGSDCGTIGSAQSNDRRRNIGADLILQ